MTDTINALLASLPADATPGQYRASPGSYSEAILRCREPHQDITVGAQIVAWCDHDETRVLLAAAPSLRDALRETVEEVERLRASIEASEKNRSAIEEWAHRYGEALCPRIGDADSFGDGMRAAKQQVLTILRGKP